MGPEGEDVGLTSPHARTPGGAWPGRPGGLFQVDELGAEICIIGLGLLRSDMF